jgi:hypothetical protein
MSNFESLLSNSVSAMMEVTFTPPIPLKDRLWEVKETLLPPRKLLFASERHLHHQAMQKGHKTHSPL